MAFALKSVVVIVFFLFGLCAVLNSIFLRVVDSNGKVTQRVGYWSPVTSNIDWCEPNYLHTKYLAEAWNSISSLIISLPGLYLFRKSFVHGMMWPCWLQAFNMTCIGIGSMFFHATLTRWAQWTDEVPMFAATCTASAAFFAGVHGLSSISVRVYAGTWISVVSFVFVAIVVLPNEIAAATFQMAFLVSVIEMSRTGWIYSGACKKEAHLVHLTELIACALGGGAIAAMAWAADFAFCDPVALSAAPWYGLSPHVLWHFAVAYATHSLSELGSYAVAGAEAQKSMGVELHYVFFGMLPILGHRAAATQQPKKD